MRQGWIQVAGLVFDICGFLLIVMEWWNAVIRERAAQLVETAKRYRDIAEELKAATPRGALGQRLLNAITIWVLKERRNALFRARELENHDPIAVFRTRLRNFVTGASLVVIGFVLQVLSAIPNGLPALGILP